MKKWTVMLIPQDYGGNTRTFHLWGYQLWLVVALMVGLSFSSAFLFGRHQAGTRGFNRVRQDKRKLELELARQAGRDRQAFSAQDRLEFEQRVRTEYEVSLAAITARLTDLRDIEDQARKLTGLGPNSPSRDNSGAVGGGKGGGSSDLGDVAYEEEDVMAGPPDVIYGLSRPSADLIIQEIDLRTGSLRALVDELETSQDQIARLPSAWPLKGVRGRLTSPFGYRKDPFTFRVRHHDGTDIAARTGTPIVATARGVVIFSERDGALGRTVRIDHGNGIVTCYAHLRKCLVDVGDEVERLDVVGSLGSSGRTTGPHLHYEVSVNGKAANPAKFLRE